jgi:hypothetical protein
MDKSNGDVIYDVPMVPVVGFVVPNGPAVELREDGGRGDGGSNISTTMPPLTTQSPWVTLHITFIVFVAVRPVRHCWFRCLRPLVENLGRAPARL